MPSPELARVNPPSWMGALTVAVAPDATWSVTLEPASERLTKPSTGAPEVTVIAVVMASGWPVRVYAPAIVKESRLSPVRSFVEEVLGLRAGKTTASPLAGGPPVQLAAVLPLGPEPPSHVTVAGMAHAGLILAAAKSASNTAKPAMAKDLRFTILLPAIALSWWGHPTTAGVPPGTVKDRPSLATGPRRRSAEAR